MLGEGLGPRTQPDGLGQPREGDKGPALPSAQSQWCLSGPVLQQSPSRQGPPSTHQPRAVLPLPRDGSGRPCPRLAASPHLRPLGRGEPPIHPGLPRSGGLLCAAGRGGGVVAKGSMWIDFPALEASGRALCGHLADGGPPGAPWAPARVYSCLVSISVLE